MTTMTTQSQVREAFWAAHPQCTCRQTPRGRILPQNQQEAETRQAFVEYVDHLAKRGQITEQLADRVTL